MGLKLLKKHSTFSFLVLPIMLYHYRYHFIPTDLGTNLLHELTRRSHAAPRCESISLWAPLQEILGGRIYVQGFFYHVFTVYLSLYLSAVSPCHRAPPPACSSHFSTYGVHTKHTLTHSLRLSLPPSGLNPTGCFCLTLRVAW